MKIVGVKDVAEMMRLDTDQVYNLAKRCIDLLLRYVHALCPPEPEATYGSNLIH